VSTPRFNRFACLHNVGIGGKFGTYIRFIWPCHIEAGPALRQKAYRRHAEQLGRLPQSADV